MDIGQTVDWGNCEQIQVTQDRIILYLYKQILTVHVQCLAMFVQYFTKIAAEVSGVVLRDQFIKGTS